MIPSYTNIKFQNTSPVAQFTSKKAQTTLIKDKIKFLFKKKDKLNSELYEHHLKAAKEWGRMWQTIHNSVNEKLHHDMEKKCKTLDLEINKLAHSQNWNPDSKTQFYPRVVNNTNIEFSDEEIALLNKGLKYNLPCNKKYWLSNLALAAEAAITTLPIHEQDYEIYQVAHNLQKLYKRYNEKPWQYTICIVYKIKCSVIDWHVVFICYNTLGCKTLKKKNTIRLTFPSDTCDQHKTSYSNKMFSVLRKKYGHKHLVHYQKYIQQIAYINN